MSETACKYCSTAISLDVQYCSFCGTSVSAEISSLNEVRRKIKIETDEEIKRKINSKKIDIYMEITERLENLEVDADSTPDFRMKPQLEPIQSEINNFFSQGLIDASDKEELESTIDSILKISENHTKELTKNNDTFQSVKKNKSASGNGTKKGKSSGNGSLFLKILFWIFSILFLPFSLLWLVPVIWIKYKKRSSTGDGNP